MKLYNKNEFGPVKPENSVNNHSSINKKLAVGYRPWKKLLATLGLLFFLALTGFCLRMNFFMIEVAMLAVAIFVAWHVLGGLMTREITFYPDRIVRRSYIGETVIPTDRLVMTREDRDIRFFHGAKENIRESLRISGSLISAENRSLILAYAQHIYNIKPYFSGALRSTTLAHAEFNKAVSSFRLLAYCSAIYLLAYVLIAIYVAGEYEIFSGFAPSFPAFPVRLAFAGAAIAAYLLLKRLAANFAGGNGIYGAPVMVRSQHAYRCAYTSAFVASGTAGLGLPLFLLFGDKLDFYLFFLVGAVYFYDFYPRLSTWERIIQDMGSSQPDNDRTPNMPRRSLQVSLVLLGTLSVLSYGANRPYLPASRQDCKDDQGNSIECQGGGHSSSGSGGHGGSGYRGDDGSWTRSNDSGNVRRGGFGFFGNSHSSFGG